MTPSSPWCPLALSDLQDALGGFTDWVLCGGYSIDLYLGKVSRNHCDVDIGIFRSRLIEGLSAFPRERIYLCDPPGTLQAWNGGEVPDRVHDIWIADPALQHWCLQILIFDDQEETVFYRRNAQLQWSKTAHAIEAGGFRILNPWISFLYKAHKPSWEARELIDLRNLIARGGGC